MAKISRPCREASLPVIKFRRPIDILLEDVGWSKKPFSYHGRNIVKENIRESRIQQPKRSEIRTVPPFSLQIKQPNTTAMAPRVTRRSKSTDPKQQDDSAMFRRLFTCGDLPVVLDHNGGPGEAPRGLRWTKHPSNMQPETITYLIPKFALGLPIIDQPFRKVAELGVNDLLDCTQDSNSLANCLPYLVRGIRASLYSFDVEKKKMALSLLTKLCRQPSIGPALIPYYRQLLPPLRKVGHSGVRVSDVSFSRGRQLDEMVQSTLNEMERNGGNSAYINIKYILPTYESCMTDI